MLFEFEDSCLTSLRVVSCCLTSVLDKLFVAF